METLTKRFADGSLAKSYPDGTWRLRLPDGTNVSGQESNEITAIAEAVNQHTEYVLKCWEGGRHTQFGFLVPLREPQPNKEVVDELRHL